MRNHRHGFTLPELLIYAALTLVVLAAVYASFDLSYRYYAAGESAAEAQQQALQGAGGIDQALRGACAGTVTVETDPPALRFLSADPGGQILFEHNGDAELVWNRWTLIYLDQGPKEVVLKEQVLSSSSPDVPVSPPPISSMIADASLSSRVLARDIESLGFGAVDADNGTDTLVTYQITSLTDSARFGENRITLGSRSLVKNQD